MGLELQIYRHAGGDWNRANAQAAVAGGSHAPDLAALLHNTTVSPSGVHVTAPSARARLDPLVCGHLRAESERASGAPKATPCGDQESASANPYTTSIC